MRELPYTPERVQQALEKAHENEHDSNLENIKNGRSKQVSSNVK
jgi:hypothetical protein